MPTYTGVDAQIGFAKKTTYGTGVTVTGTPVLLKDDNDGARAWLGGCPTS